MLKEKIRILAVIMILFSTLLTSSCGKNQITTNIHESGSGETEEFCEAFFTENYFPYQKINRTDVQNTPEEYLFYIKDGIVYRTLNDYFVVIVNRTSLSESEEKRKTNYTGEIYQIFEGDNYDILLISTRGSYAILSLPSAIPAYENSELIKAFNHFDYKHSS